MLLKERRENRSLLLPFVSLHIPLKEEANKIIIHTGIGCGKYCREEVKRSPSVAGENPEDLPGISQRT